MSDEECNHDRKVYSGEYFACSPPKWHWACENCGARETIDTSVEVGRALADAIIAERPWGEIDALGRTYEAARGSR